MVEDGRTTWFLARGERTYSVAVGDTVDEYRLEQATPAGLLFTYTPLGTRQPLPIPALN
jgi:hypothetical protein